MRWRLVVVAALLTEFATSLAGPADGWRFLAWHGGEDPENEG